MIRFRLPFLRLSARTILLILVCLATGHLVAAVPGPTHTLYIPTSASIHGNAGTFFHTDLWVFNRSFDSSLSVTANYRCFTGPCSPTPASSSFVLAPRESRLFGDAVVSLFGMAETAGAIELIYTADAQDLAATTRTYTPSLPLATNGTAVPALSISDARTRALFLGLGSNAGNLTSGFRTNAGAYNPGPRASVVTYTLFRHDGTLIGSASVTLQSQSAGQINDVFLAAGAGSMVTTDAFLVVTSKLPVFPFVTVVDNQSGDSVYAAPTSDEPAVPTASHLVNGGFDSNLVAWTNELPGFIAMSWSPADATGNPESGSVRVTNSVPAAGGAGSGPEQCVALTPGSTVSITVRMRIPPGQSATATVNPQVYAHPSGDCSGSSSAGQGLSMRGPSLPDTWETQTAMWTVPPGIHSAKLMLWISKTTAAGTFTAYFDDVSVVTSSR